MRVLRVFMYWGTLTSLFIGLKLTLVKTGLLDFSLLFFLSLSFPTLPGWSYLYGGPIWSTVRTVKTRSHGRGTDYDFFSSFRFFVLVSFNVETIYFKRFNGSPSAEAGLFLFWL